MKKIIALACICVLIVGCKKSSSHTPKYNNELKETQQKLSYMLDSNIK